MSVIKFNITDNFLAEFHLFNYLHKTIKLHTYLLSIYKYMRKEKRIHGVYFSFESLSHLSFTNSVHFSVK